MAKNIQCPVCTLYLHAGMNLSDHLETHPKEQVIKALVEMTISGNDKSAFSIDGSESIRSASIEKLNDNSIYSSTIKDHDINSICSTSSTSNSSIFDQSVNNTSINFNESNATDGCSTASSSSSKTGVTWPSNSRNANKGSRCQQLHQHQQHFQQKQSHSKQSIEVNDGEHYNDETVSMTVPLHSEYSYCVVKEYTRTDEQHSTSTLTPDMAGRVQSTTCDAKALSVLQKSELHANVPALLPTSMPLPLVPQLKSVSSGQRQCHAFSNHAQQQTRTSSSLQQHKQNPMPASELYPRPPFQLYKYQTSITSQHLKPPPAYGTAISQIRSQNKHNKQTLRSEISPEQLPGEHILQNKQQHLADTSLRHSQPPLSPSPFAAYRSQQQKPSNSPTYSASLLKRSVNLAKSGVDNPALLQTSQLCSTSKMDNIQKGYKATRSGHVHNDGPLLFSTKHSAEQTTTSTAAMLLQASSPTSPSATLTSIPAATPSTSGRHNNIMVSSTTLSSSASVLCYAESPVAHYLERDNGDFIVQETPKHIMEYVEKEDGKFSVIERIYQSPPSVLRIHDENLDDDDNELNDYKPDIINDDDDANSQDPSQADRKEIPSKATTKANSSPGGKLMKSPSAEAKAEDEDLLSNISVDETKFAVCKTEEHIPEPENIIDHALSTKTKTTPVPNKTTVNTPSAPRKRSSKNTITVLSDVSLNLNEYLDLVGNIMASSKISPARGGMSSIASMPTVKIEKEEPPDDEEFQIPLATNNNTQETDQLPTDVGTKANIRQPNTRSKLVATNEPSTSSSCSGHATSVIRMASTTPKAVYPDDEQADNEDVHINRGDSAASSAHANTRKPYGKSLLRKPPKKLVIKPKLTKTTKLLTSPAKDVASVVVVDDDQKPSTSAKALSEFEQAKQLSMANGQTQNTPFKNTEKIRRTWHTAAAASTNKLTPGDGLTRLTVDGSLEQELKKEKKPYDTSTSDSSAGLSNFNATKEIGVKNEPICDNLNDAGPSDVIMDFEEEKPRLIASTITCLKTESDSNVNEDAEVLYAFAKSNKTLKTDTPPGGSIANANNNESMNIPSNPYRKNDSPTELASNTISESSGLGCNNNSQQNAVTTFMDYPFGFLYNGNPISTPISSRVGTIKQDRSEQEHAHHHHQSQSTSSNEWFTSNDANNSTSASTAAFNKTSADLRNPATTSIMEYNDTDTDVVSRYLDLDACKQEHKYDMSSSLRTQPSPSSTASCSFNAHNTDNSLAANCYQSSGLNIRTDEKMPAKGEISEQESNCDIDNSWSQPMTGEMPARFFKTSSPSIFTHDSGWNHDDYFAAQDLSASSATPVDFVVQNRSKSFEFYLPADTNSDSDAMAMAYHPNGLPIFSQQNPNDVTISTNTEFLPSTSSKMKRKRKRTTEEDKMLTTAATTTATAAIPNIEQPPEQHFQHHHVYLTTNDMTLQQQQVATTSSLIYQIAGADNSHLLTVLAQQPKVRDRTYECARCFAKYNKLKDRNAHMIEVHKYVRHNRKLICPQSLATSTITRNLELSELAPSTSAQIPQNNDLCEDSKQGIVKIETEAASAMPPPLVDIKTNFPTDTTTKLEIDENKQNLLAMSSSTSSTSIITNNLDDIQQLQDRQQQQQLSQNPNDVKAENGLPVLPFMNTSNSKQTSMYRMLIAYNMNNLKMKQELPEIDEKFIQSLIFYCHICRRSFSSIKQYDIHLTEHPAECFSCGKQFQRWKNLSLHLKRHMGWKEFACTVCDKKFVVRSALVEHMRMHSGHSPLKCKVCGKHFKRYSNLTQHRKRHFKKVLRRKEYVCYCGEVLPSKARFLWHKETHDSKPKCCPHCCDRFVHVNSLKRHIRLAHSDKFDYVEPVECTVCKQVFAKTSMKSHMATHTADNQYDCTLCNKSFSTKWNLKVHSWVHANRTAKPYKCEYCPKAFIREVDFKNHLNSHKQIRPYTCEVCGCKFIRKYNYMRHRREHHGDKKFTCELCKKSFHRHYYLIEHRRIHTGERPFQCNICGKSSTTKTNHNKHMKIHHSRDPFTVEV